MIPEPAVSVEQIAAIVALAGSAATAVLWFVGTKFATKASIGTLHRRIEELDGAIRLRVNQVEDKAREATNALGQKVTDAVQKQELADQSTHQTSKDIAEIKDLLRGELAKISSTQGQHGERLTKLETLATKRR
jgi:hypothetical protein